MANFQVSLSYESPAPVWGANSSVTFSESGATIHLNSTGEYSRQIQRAARKIDALGIPAVEFIGDWNKAYQWAFAISFTRARNPSSICFIDNSDKTELEKDYAALLFTRQLVNDTPEDLSPLNLAQRAANWLHELDKDSISYRYIVGEQLKEAGWVGIYNVGRGSERPPVMLELDYNPSGNPDTPVTAALVGKGITFDSGGYSIKSSEGMLDMKCDMGGAATVTGSLGLAIMKGVQSRIKLFLCCAENLISGHAYKLGDVLNYKNGVSVEIVNTDAEGRLVLADGLMAATDCGAELIIDAATLTGAAVVALGNDYNGVFSLDRQCTEQFLACADKKDELFWPLPLQKWHKDRCPSHFADTANSRPQKGGGAGGASNAAGFLSRFVNEEGKGWLHLDLAAAYHGNATAEMPAGATASGIKTIAEMLLQQAKVE